MNGFYVFAAAHLMLPVLTLAMVVLVVAIGQARRRWVGARLTPPPIAPKLPPSASPRARVDRRNVNLSLRGSSARRQRQVIDRHRVGY